MRKVTLLCLSTVLSLSTLANDLYKYLINPPQQLSIDEGCYSDIHLQANQLKNFVLSLRKVDFLGEISIAQPIDSEVFFDFSLDSINMPKQGYELNIQANQIHVKGHSFAALYYAKQTILQLLEYSINENAPLPCLSINDWPDFERRGYMLDISRDKVPTMESLYRLIDQLSDWKINELQLYTEHTFAYKEHKVVWKNSSPLTAEEIQALDVYCKARHIDLVPNQNSFGHMENWLKHDEYLDLAECPEDCQTIWGKRKRTSLDPTNPNSLELMKSLYAEVLPNFSSQFFNIGGDETVELCEGKSKAECEKVGKGQVYLNYLKKLNSEANQLGFKTQFWGDIILNHPELISQLPKDMTALVWGYEDDHPFDEQLPKFKAAGLDFYVCPGTSSWRSIVGRDMHGVKNLMNAAQAGKSHGAKGYLITNWGDYGHWQPLSVVYPSIIMGARFAWHYEEKFPIRNWVFQLNHYVYKDSTGNTAKAVMQLATASGAGDIPKGNANIFHLLLRRYLWTMEGNYQTKVLTLGKLDRIERSLNWGVDLFLQKSKPQSMDSTIIIQELNHAVGLARHAIKLGRARLTSDGFHTKNIEPEIKEELIVDLKALIKAHKEIWTVRNREGGLLDSAAKLEALLDYYISGPDK